MARKLASRGNAPDLHCHSHFSILDGAGTPEQVVMRAKELGWGAACLTEHGHLISVPQFYLACKAHKIKPVLGIEMYVVPDGILGVHSKETRSASFHLTVLALSREGYQNLLAWNNASMQRENFYYRPRISLEQMVEIAPWPLHHNVILSGCLGGELAQTLLTLNGERSYAAWSYVESMRSVFPNFYIELQDHGLPKFYDKGFERYDEMVDRERFVRNFLVLLAEATGTPFVLTNDSHYQSPSQRKAHIAMLASKMNSWSKQDTYRGASNEHLIKGYAREYGYWTNYMRSMETIADRFDYGQEAIDNIHSIVAEADVVLPPLDKFSYSIPFSGHDNPIGEIRVRSRSRLKRLHRLYGQTALDRFEHELKAMGGFAHYLLMMSDFITWATSQGIYTEVRGSANASIVCYCLHIHDVDSIKYKLTFERFVNPERAKLPDIDIDIEFDRYEDFMQFVTEYVEQREGPGQVRLLCNYGTLANRSSFRMIAETLGVDKETQDEIANLLPQMIDSGIVDEEDDAYAMLKDQYPEIYELASGVFDTIKSVGQHACGWVFGTKERPLDDWVPVYLIASSGKLVTQFDYKTMEKFGLNKGDFLRQKYLSVMKRCATMLGWSLDDLKKIPLDDPETMEMIREGRTEGVFTLQGKTNRQGSVEVEPEDEHGVIATVAIYRPSLTRPGYHRVYNQRRRGDEDVEYPHAVAEKVLAETFGLPIFQEQILDLGYGIGFNHVEAQELLDAIKLAKGVGRGASEAFGEIHPRFVRSATKSGLTADEAEGVWELVEGFQGYGFNRAHATGYGIRAVRAAYLKRHYPQEFFTALLDVYPEKGAYIAAAKSEGLSILPPDVNLSGAGFSRGEDNHSIRVGLARIKHVGPAAIKEIVAGQPYGSLSELRERTSTRAVDKRTIEVLGAVGALSAFGIAASDDDTEQLRLLSFLLTKPKALKGIRPKHTNSRESDSWRHQGLVWDVELTERRASVSKLFWIPELEDGLLELKASPWARVKTWLLAAVDVNGLPFQIMANEDKPEEAAYLKFMAKHCVGAAICLDGAIKQSFEKDGPMGFRLYDVTGAIKGESQVWGMQDEKMAMGFSVLSKRKRQSRKKA